MQVLKKFEVPWQCCIVILRRHADQLPSPADIALICERARKFSHLHVMDDKNVELVTGSDSLGVPEVCRQRPKKLLPLLR